MPDFDRTGWTATADSESGATGVASRALDGSLSTWWQSTSVHLGRNSHWIAVDMQAAHLIDYVRVGKSAVQFDTPNPYWVEVYLSQDGIDWGAAVASMPWPADHRDQWVVFPPQVARHFKLVGYPYGYPAWPYGMGVNEIYAGKLAHGDVYKRYWKAHPQHLVDLYPLTAPNHGVIEYNTLQLDLSNPTDLQMARAVAHMHAWSFGPLAFYPEIVASGWDLPTPWPPAGLESITAVVDSTKLVNPSYGAFVSPTFSFSEDSVQSYFDFIYQWFHSPGPWTMPPTAPSWPAVPVLTFWDKDSGGVITPAQVPDLHHHIYVWGSTSGSGDNEFTIADHYLLLVFPATYLAPETYGGCVVFQVKNPAEPVYATLDFSKWLDAGDAISTATWTSPNTAVTIVETAATATTASARATLTGAVDNDTFVLKCAIATQRGLVEVRRVEIRVRTADYPTRSPRGWWRLR
jgi:hypothetical protein